MSAHALSVLGGATPGQRECSRAGCTDAGSWSIAWRNPRIHAADRRKVWLACDAHLEFLRVFLESRDFPVMVSPLDSQREVQ